MNSKKRAIGVALSATLLASLLSVVGAASASADTGVARGAATDSAPKQCLVEPAKTKTIHHDAVYEDVTIVHDGKAAVTQEEQRWTRDIPMVDAVTGEEAQYVRTIEAQEELSYDRWNYVIHFEGFEEESHQEYRFSRHQPGSDEVAHTEYLAIDGSPVRNLDDAAWFIQPVYDGWEQYGEPRTVIDQPAVPPATYYLTVNKSGDIERTLNREEASWFTEDPAELPADTQLLEYETVVLQEAVPAQTLYLTMAEDGTFGETDDPALASWIPFSDDNGVDTSVWSQLLDEVGAEVVRTVTLEEAVPAYSEFYVADAAPTRELGDTNWTTDQPDGWTLVDTRVVTLQEPEPSWTETISVLKKDAWSEKKVTAAVYGECTLAYTGSGLSLTILVSAGVLLLVLGAIVMGRSRRRNRYTAE